MDQAANRRRGGGGYSNTAHAHRPREGRHVPGLVLGCLLVVALLSIPARAQTGSVAAAMQALQQQYAGVQFHESGGRVRAVYGVPMTSSSTAREAAQRWIASYAGVFGAGALRLTEHSFVTTGSGHMIVSYRQSLSDVPVEGSMVTLVLLNVAGNGLPQAPRPTVVCAAARTAIPPPGGLPAPVITPSQAQLIAQSHSVGVTIAHWMPPESVVLWSDAAATAYARRAIKLIGSGSLVTPPSAFYIDALSGEVLDVRNIAIGFDITGTITGIGTGTQPLEPDTWGTTSSTTPPGTGTLACPNSTLTLGPLSRVKVTALNPSTGAPLASAFTASNGAYSLALTGGSPVNVMAEFVGPFWRIRDGSNWTFAMGPFCCNFASCCTPLSCCHPVAGAEPYGSNPVATSASGINIALNPTPSEFTTAQVNGLHHIERTQWYFQSRLSESCDCYVPGLHDTVDVIVNYAHPTWGNGAWTVVELKSVWFGKYFADLGANNEHANYAYSTVLSHEYGHYLLYWMRNISPSSPTHRAFHEGFGDTLALLLHQTSEYQENSNNIGLGYTSACGFVTRQPLTYNYAYVDCEHTDPYDKSQMLSHAWLDIESNFIGAFGSTEGRARVRQLHATWSLLTMGGEDACGAGAYGEAAHPGTALEVLVADDNDGNLQNQTPHWCLICNAFAARGITCPPIPPGCGDSLGAGRGDCDGDGMLSMRDAECFHRAFVEQSRLADINGDGSVNVVDWMGFAMALGR